MSTIDPQGFDLAPYRSPRRAGGAETGHSAASLARVQVPFRVRVSVRLTCAAVAFALMIGSGYAWALYKNFTNSVPHGAAVPALASGQKDLDGSAQNILMIGNDSRAGATRAEQNAMHSGHNDGTVNTDTMMIMHIPSDGGKPTIISFPRDSWVSIPGHGKAKLN